MEIVVVVGVGALMFFFGRGRVIEWAKTIGQAKKAFDDASKEEKKE